MIVDFFNDDPLTATYHQYLQGSYDPSTSEYSITQVDTPMQAIMLDLTRSSNGASSKFGTNISEGDKEIYLKPIPSSSIIPDPTSDKVTVGSWTYKMAVVKSLDPTGTSPMLYNLYLRR